MGSQAKKPGSFRVSGELHQHDNSKRLHYIFFPIRFTVLVEEQGHWTNSIGKQDFMI
jgi:hypothetical protein